MTDEYKLIIKRKDGSTYSAGVTYNGERFNSPIEIFPELKHHPPIRKLSRNLINKILSDLEEAKIPANNTRVSRIETTVYIEDSK